MSLPAGFGADPLKKNSTDFKRHRTLLVEGYEDIFMEHHFLVLMNTTLCISKNTENQCSKFSWTYSLRKTRNLHHWAVVLFTDLSFLIKCLSYQIYM